jgi:hypothetical protein
VSSAPWQQPDPALTGGGAIDQPAEERAEESATILSQVSYELMAIPGVEGLGLTNGPDGGDAIVVYVRDASVATKIPSAVGELPTVVEVTGQIDALPKF